MEEIMKRTLTVLKLGVVAAVAATCLSGGTASAQSLQRGTFTLPYEVNWGGAVLSPGRYTISFDSVRGPAMVRTAAGDPRAILFARSIGDSRKDQPNALLITQRENQRFVSAFNWRGGDKVFEYAPDSKRKLVAAIDDKVEPILMTQK
jgi:hypothetical protein